MTRNRLNGSPKPPKHLGTAGRALWRQLQTDYEITDCGGLAVLSQACESLDRVRSAQEIIRREGEIVTNRLGAPTAHPAVGIELQARAAMLKALAALRLDVEPLKNIGRPPGGPGAK